MEEHIVDVAKSTPLVWDLLHPFLDQETPFNVIYAFVTSRLNYCNMLYMELPLRSIQKLQLVQNELFAIWPMEHNFFRGCIAIQHV